jgi:acetate kinase
MSPTEVEKLWVIENRTGRLRRGRVPVRPGPRQLSDEGVCRYGFHGLSYESIASAPPGLDSRAAAGLTVVAHLGIGASLCAMLAGRSTATMVGSRP